MRPSDCSLYLDRDFFRDCTTPGQKNGRLMLYELVQIVLFGLWLVQTALVLQINTPIALRTGLSSPRPAPRFRPVLGLEAPAAPFGSFGTFRDLGSPEPQNVHVHVLGFLADRPPRRPTFRNRGGHYGYSPQLKIMSYEAHVYS